MKDNLVIENDHLTGLHSRWYCRMALQKIIEEGGNRVFGLIDLDGFHEINEQYGTEVGDRLLQAIAEALRQTYPEATLCRNSGDEFAFILNPTDYCRQNMSLMTRNLFEHLHSIHLEELEGRHLAFSIGTSFIDTTLLKTPDDIYNESKELCKIAKQHEGNFLCSRYGMIPDVEGAFLDLRDDRALYNDINNRLFSIHDEADWLEYLHKGASLKGSMYKRNQGHLDDILTYYSADDLPDVDYELLFQLVTHYAHTLDAFMFEMIVERILLPHYEKCDKQDPRVKSQLGHLYLLMADSLVSVVRMGDASKHERIIELLHKCREVCRDLPHDSLGFEPYFYSLCETLGHYESFDIKPGVKNDCEECYEELRQLLLGQDPFVIPNQDVYKYFEHLVNNARFYPLFRACYLRLKRERLSKEGKEEFARVIEHIRTHLVNGVFDLIGPDPLYQKISILLQDILFNDLNYNQTLEKLIHSLRFVKEEMEGTISNSNLILVAYLFLGSSQVLPLTDLPAEQKREIGIRGLNLLIAILRRRESLATDSQILFLTQVLVRTMISSPVITAADKYYYIERTMAAVTLDTYSHSKAVAAYAKVILSNMVDNHPQLLAGPDRPYSTIEQVKANKENLLRFMSCACMLHDVGKFILTPITSNAFRKLTDQEFELIRLHPKHGVDILRPEPAFEPFLPFVYTHHRWWNGAYGYPTIDADEQRSKLQDLVYILSFCDSLEAATSRIGRNYRSSKSFLKIFDEFYVEAGTRYSGEVMWSIISSPDTYNQIRQMVDVSWQNIYQSIFQEVVATDPSAQPDINATVPSPYEHTVSAVNAKTTADTYLLAFYTSADYQQLHILKSNPLFDEAAQKFSTTEELNRFACRYFVNKEYQAEFTRFFDLKHVQDCFKQRHSKISLEYYSSFNGWVRANIVPVNEGAEQEPTHLLIYIEDINAERQ